MNKNEKKALFVKLSLLFSTIIIVLSILEIGGRNLEKKDFEIITTIGYDNKLHILSNTPNLIYEMDNNKDILWLGNNIHTNSMGVRDKDYKIPKPDDVYRILILGDSITFGLLLEQNEIYSEKLEIILNENDQQQKYEVINGGVSGYNTLQELILLKTKLIDYEPDIVILGFFLNDFYRAQRMFREEDKIILKAYTSSALSIPIVIPLPKKVNDLLLVKSYSYRYINIKLFAIIKKMDSGFSPKNTFTQYQESTQNELLEMKKFLDKNNIPMIMVVFPYLDNNPDLLNYEIPVDKAISIAKGYDIETINMLVHYQKRLGDFSEVNENPDDKIHPNAYGHTIIAETIHEYLVEQGLI